MAKDKMLKMKS